MSILTPVEIEARAGWAECFRTIAEEDRGVATPTVSEMAKLIGTLAAYAKVVERVAEMDPLIAHGDADNEWCECRFCGNTTWVDPDHEPDCPYLEALRLRGLE